VRIFPAARLSRKTFLEIYQDTVFIRREGDTVHMSSWVIFHNGGFDRDSPYEVRVADGIEALMPPGSNLPFPGGPVLTKGPANGSPVGFRSRVTNYLTPNGPLSATAQSGVYPLYDPNDVLHFPRIAAYHPMFQSGKAYALQRAEDGDQARDGRIEEARPVGENPLHPLRDKVLVFYVNFPPILQTDNPIFRPRVAVVDTFYSRTWDLRLPADDIDPYVSGDRVGGPSSSKVVRIRLTVRGTDLNGDPLTLSDPPESALQQKYINVSDINLLVPDDLATGPATLTVELCDCSFCEVNPGEGRCITRDIQVYYVRPSSAPPASISRPGLK
jgi:hypothetical protein